MKFLILQSPIKKNVNKKNDLHPTSEIPRETQCWNSGFFCTWPVEHAFLRDLNSLVMGSVLCTDGRLVGYDAPYFGRNLPTLRRNLLFPFTLMTIA